MVLKIQLFARIQDIIPTEYWIVKPIDSKKIIDPDEKNFSKGCFNSLKMWKDDIRKNGIKHPLYVHPSGHIADGNGRYWCARKLFKEGHKEFAYLPIDLYFLTGYRDNYYPKPPIISPRDMWSGDPKKLWAGYTDGVNYFWKPPPRMFDDWGSEKVYSIKK